MILVTGATGTIGRTLVRDLAAAGAPTRALVRDLPSGGLGVDAVLGSFGDDASLRRALDGVERLFLLSPAGDREMVAVQTRLVDLAAQAGVRHVVKLSSIAADEPTAARIVRAHRTIERHIERSGLAWTHLRPHWFMQNELGQAASIAGSGTFHAPDVSRISAIDARDIAAAAAAVLTGEGHEQRAYVLTGPQALSYADVADSYTRVLGRPVRWAPVTLDEARASMTAAGLPAELAAGFAEIMAGYRRGGVTARVSPDAERLLGRAPRTFDQFVDDHREHFAAGWELAA